MLFAQFEKVHPRSLILLFSVLFICSSAIDARNIRQTDNHASLTTFSSNGIGLEFELTDLQSERVSFQNEDFETNVMPGEGFTYEYGKPMLPMVSRFVIVPPDVGLELEYEVLNTSRVQLDGSPLYCLDEELIMEGVNQPIGVNEIFPSVPVEMSEARVIRGVRLVKITTYPIQYDPDTEEFVYNGQISTNIRFTDNEPINPVRLPFNERRNHSPEFMKFIDALAINSDVLRRDDLESYSPWMGHYLVVGHEECIDRLDPFIHWKRKAGYKLDIESIPSGQSRNFGTIKGRIDDVYEGYLDDGQEPFDHLMLIGDYSNHENCGPNSNWVLESHAGESVWGHANHADYKYALMEGNDNLPDVAVSRWCSGNANLMALNIGRTLAYEAQPDMDDPDWFTRGAAGSYHWGNSAVSAWHVSIQTNVRWAEEVLKNLDYDDVRFYENYNWDRMAGQYGPWIRDQHNDGVNVILSRAECYNWRSSYAGVNNNTIFPIRLNTCGHGEWATWHQTRTGSGNSLKGPVAATCGWGGPATVPMSLVWMGLVKGVMHHDMTFAWGWTFGVVNMEKIIPDYSFGWRNQRVYLSSKTDTDTYGDPGIQPWRGIPAQYEMEFPETISTETKLIDVLITNPEDDDAPVEGARVTLYIPDNNATDEPTLQISKFTDEDGFAHFIFGEGEGFDNGTMFVTLAGRDIYPVFGEIEIENRISEIDYAAYALNEVEGNDDDQVNPGETFNLGITASNLSGAVDFENVIATVSSLSPWIDLEDGEISFGDIDAGDIAQSEDRITFHVDPSCPDGSSRPSTRPILSVEFHSGDDIFISAIMLDPESPRFEVKRVVGGSQIDVGRQDLDIEIENVGSQNSQAIIAILSTMGMGVGIVNEEVRFPTINSGRSARIQGDDFVISGNSIAIPGSTNPLMLVLTTEDGFVDTAYFKVIVDEPREGAPQGPDGYGYICFDNTDDDWDISPDYEWIEINPDDDDREFDGEECDFDGRSDQDVGESEVVEMGMSTTFYGKEFDEITISTNGFIAMGDQGRITNPQNWPMDQAIGGGIGMLAPFWDWLDYTNNSGIFYYHDEEEARFIIQWHRMRHHQGGNSDLTFQVILYDQEVWITEGGDQNILFQYRNISNVRGQRDGVAWEKNIPFASVGISSVDGTTGLNYTYNNEYPVTSATLQNRRALLFATSPRFRSGDLLGNVIDEETGAGIEGVTVYTEHGFTGMTDENGDWSITDALAEVPFDIYASKQSYNDGFHGDLFLEEDTELEINFSLLHPEFVPSDQGLAAMLEIDEATELEFTIQNTGNGTLEWSVIQRLRGDANAEPWEFRRDYNVGEQVEDARIQGVVFADDRFYVSGSNDRAPVIYVFNRDFELIDTFDQPPAVEGDVRGIRDLAWDGELLWGAFRNTIFGMDTDGNVVREWASQYNPTVGIAWDPDRQALWLSATTSNPVGFTREGERIIDLMVVRRGLYIYGLAFWPDDPDDYNLYFFHKEPQTNRPLVHKFNPDTGDSAFVASPEHQNGGRPAGAFITNQFDVYSWVWMTILDVPADDGGDRIDIWQLDARREWFDLQPIAGEIAPGEQQDFILTLNAESLPTVRFEADMVFYHNADDGEFILPITLDVVEGERDLQIDLIVGWNLISSNALPEDLGIRAVFTDLVENDQLVMVKNREGSFYYPVDDFENIGDWIISEGYQVNVSEASQMNIRGNIVPSDEPIQLVEGWNMSAYFPHTPIDAETALISIVEQLIIVKDGSGRFYMPEFGYSNIGEMSEGKGYQLKMSEDAELVYPLQRMFAANLKPKEWVSHFNSAPSSEDNMSVLILGNPEMEDWELGAYNSSGDLIGSGCFNSIGKCGIAVWGDDTVSEKVDGALEGEQIIYKVWTGTEEVEIHPTIVAGSGQWKSEEYMVGKIDSELQTPLSFGIHKTYPNPTNGPMRLIYGLEKSGMADLKVFDLNGRQVAQLLRTELSAGNHQFTWDTNLVSSGIYLIRLESGGNVNTTKVAVIQ